MLTPSRQLTDAEKLRKVILELVETERTYVKVSGLFYFLDSSLDYGSMIIFSTVEKVNKHHKCDVVTPHLNMHLTFTMSAAAAILF